MTWIYIFDMLLIAEEFDTILPGHIGIYQRSDFSKMNELFDPRRQHIP